MTRVVVPLVRGMLNPATYTAVIIGTPDGDVWWTPLDPADVSAYPRVLVDHWERGEDFAIVEQDVEPRPGWLASFDACPSGWCIIEPTLRPGLDWLGCVRFRASFLRGYPDAAYSAMSIDDDGDRSWTWTKCDVRLARVLRSLHAQPCFHGPTAVHHHRKKATA